MTVDTSGPTPLAHARLLLDAVGRGDLAIPVMDQRPASLLWAQSGAMWLSGHRDGPPRHCPAPLAACAQGAWLALAALCPRLDPTFDAFHLLGERAAIAGLSRQGRLSPGGACRLLDTADGVLALNLARDDDFDLLPAWLQRPTVDMAQLPALVAKQPTAVLVERARLLGLAAAAVSAPRPRRGWFEMTRHGKRLDTPTRAPLVVDLGALWAAPLCGQLLRQCGARVIKVESLHRPDGARRGPAPFFDLMNGGKQSLALDLRQPEGVEQLRRLLTRADIVIESARPRGLEQMGIFAADILAAHPGKVWLGITGYGRQAPNRDWIAYGDDAGVAAGLSWLMGGERGDPVFCGDAIADPLAGLHGAVLAWAFWLAGGGVLLDLSLAGVVAHCVQAGPAPEGAYPAVPPRARTPCHQAAALGVDTERVLAELAP